MTNQKTEGHVSGNAGTQAQTASDLSRYRYLNPEFMPNHTNEKCYRKHRASCLAGDLWALVSTIECAIDSESGVPIENRGISATLGLATNLASDLIDLCETLEKELGKAVEAARQTQKDDRIETEHLGQTVVQKAEAGS